MTKGSQNARLAFLAVAAGALFGLSAGAIAHEGNVIGGTAGNDTLDGHQHSDWMFGFQGADTLSGHDGDDLIVAGPGVDEVHGHKGNDELYGDDGPDVMTGNDNVDIPFEGGQGADLMHGGGGWERSCDASGCVGISGNLHDDIIAGNEGGDYLFGGDGADELYGNAGDDYLAGGGGDHNHCWGGTGDDTFHISCHIHDLGA